MYNSNYYDYYVCEIRESYNMTMQLHGENNG